MKERREVRTQKELERATEDDCIPICVGGGRFVLWGSSHAELWGSSHAVLCRCRGPVWECDRRGERVEAGAA